ncbi:MAG: hypothetical protein ACI9UQ_000451, partial [Candidatus Krumholzibacteriia bacterium]
PLWIFGLALLLKLGLSPFAAATVFGGLSGLLVLVLVEKALNHLSFMESWKTWFMVIVAADAWFLRWSWSGMETPLATAMLLVLLWPLFMVREYGEGVVQKPLWRRYLAWGVAAGLAGLVRPEFMLIGPLALPPLLSFEYYRAGSMGGLSGRYQARPHGPFLAAIAGWILVIGPWLGFAWVHFGRILPETASAKSSAALPSIAALLGFSLQAVKMLAATQGLLWVGLLVLVALTLYQNVKFADTNRTYAGYWGGNLDDTSAQGPGAGPWSVWGPVALASIAGIWVVALIGGYAVRQVWIISRYVSPLAPVLLLAMIMIAEWLQRGAAIEANTKKISQAVVLVFSLMTVVANVWLFTSKVLPHTRQFPVGVRECYLDLGYWLAENTPEDAVIAALDIGALGYASDRQVLDLMGLVSPEVLHLGASMGFAEMVVSGDWLLIETDGRRATYFVDRSQGDPRWKDKIVHGVRFELMSTCVLNGVGLRESGPWTVALYQLMTSETGVKSTVGG